MSRAVIGLAVVMAAVSLQARADPPLATVLARAAAYVADYQTRLAGIVAEEHYRQNVQIQSRGGRQMREFRELRSDLLMVKPTGADRWLQFRG